MEMMINISVQFMSEIYLKQLHKMISMRSLIPLDKLSQSISPRIILQENLEDLLSYNSIKDRMLMLPLIIMIRLSSWKEIYESGDLSLLTLSLHIINLCGTMIIG